MVFDLKYVFNILKNYYLLDEKFCMNIKLF